MGLIASLRRWRYVYGWRLRYWWLDTRSGERAQVAALFLGGIVCVVEVLRVALVVAQPAPHPQQAFLWWVVQLVILIVSSLISAALRPKPKAPTPQTADAPNTDDGQTVKHHFGTRWVDDQFILEWKVVGTDKIRAKGGK